MIYTTQIRRKKAASSLASDLIRHGPKIAKRLEPRMAAVLEEGEEMPDVAHLLDVLGRMLVLESEGLEELDWQRSREGTEVIQARRELNQRIEPELRSRVIWVRDQMRNAYGAKRTNELLNHEGRTPRAREGLKQMAENMVRLLPTAELPKPMPGSPVKPADWAEYVRHPLIELVRYLGKLGKHSGDQVVVVGQRNQALATFDRNYSSVLGLTELFYKLSGEDSLVKHLHHHPGRSKGRPAEQDSRGAGQRNVAPDVSQWNSVAPEAGERNDTPEAGTGNTAPEADPRNVAPEVDEPDQARQERIRRVRRASGSPRVA